MTKNKKTGQEILMRPEAVKAMLEGSSDMIQVTDARGNLKYVSPSMKRILGYAPAAPLGESVFKIVHPDDLSKVRNIFKEVLTHPQKPMKVLCRCRHINGTWRYIEAWAKNDLKNPAIEGIILNIRDISDHIQAQASATESEAKFRSIIEQSNDGITIIDDTGTIIVFNSAQERLSGVPSSKAIGKKVWDIQYKLMKDSKRRNITYREFVKSYRQFLSTGNGPWLEKMFEVEMVRQDGAAIQMQTIVSPIKLNSGIIYASFNRDITDLQQARKDLEEQNRLLQEKNMALREIMAQIEEEKKNVARKIKTNIERHVLPLIERVKVASAHGVRQYCSIVEENLNEIMAPFTPEIENRMHTLTPKEIELCHLIKHGLRCKEIAQVMNISYRTVETHRNRIRKKLGITNPGVNLPSYLQSF
jgi:PAS domain S-box-containing protein